jgi:uncharacterized protein YndB with AHSA1/START domain
VSQSFLYSVEREFPATIEKLWSAWTEATKLEKWYHGIPHSSTKDATSSDLHIGGLWSCGVDVPEHNFVAYFFGKYTRIETLKLIEHTLHYTQSKDEFDAKNFETPSHLIVLNFEDRGNASWVKFSQFGELPEGQASQAQEGMESYLDSLAQFLAN